LSSSAEDRGEKIKQAIAAMKISRNKESVIVFEFDIGRPSPNSIIGLPSGLGLNATKQTLCDFVTWQSIYKMRQRQGFTLEWVI
jgi:hypothetical protein